jgi:pimeloyl-ACP methyl ester carboxylesterase
MVMLDDQPTYRIWGKPPFTTVILHKGPGAAGDVASLANELGKHSGVIEPFQTGITIKSQINEIKFVIEEKTKKPVVLIGHSWGAWLGFIFTSHHPELIKKLIMVGTPPFEDKDVAVMRKIREDRISNLEKNKFDKITSGLKINPKESFQKMGELMSKIDSYDLLPIHDEVDFRSDIYTSIWNEAEKMRKENQLLHLTTKISCPVIAIHGDYDPHPWQGVKIPLEERILEFKFILLEKCGHYPWKEKFARESFLKKMIEELV